jgi:hypothetical protein
MLAAGVRWGGLCLCEGLTPARDAMSFLAVMGTQR